MEAAVFTGWKAKYCLSNNNTSGKRENEENLWHPGIIFAALSLLYRSERHAVTLNFFNRNNLMTN
jgi:hypothetical protein